MTSKQVGGDHYASKRIEPFLVIRDWCGDEGFAAYLRGNIIKYICRYKDKNGTEDLLKARHYLDELIFLEEDMKTGILDQWAEEIANAPSDQ